LNPPAAVSNCIMYIYFFLGTLLANQDNMEFNYKCNAFELYGADFLLSYDLKPWLIEINSSPALGGTTAVTARMCATMLEDIVRVTVDRRKGRNVDTGGFELIYRQNSVQPPLFVGTSLCVQGAKVNINSQPKG
jgi:tubulin monoglycylase TTLL3/8